VKDADKLIVKWIKEKGRLIKQEQYKHSKHIINCLILH
jgi:isoleucyl-tRNA synthetase